MITTVIARTGLMEQTAQMVENNSSNPLKKKAIYFDSFGVLALVNLFLFVII